MNRAAFCASERGEKKIKEQQRQEGRQRAGNCASTTRKTPQRGVAATAAVGDTCNTAQF